tara:strand:+ start:215 stop:469 length:255 start_codon:yes stop_codon:yes gene_type:complete
MAGAILRQLKQMEQSGVGVEMALVILALAIRLSFHHPYNSAQRLTGQQRIRRGVLDTELEGEFYGLRETDSMVDSGSCLLLPTE